MGRAQHGILASLGKWLPALSLCLTATAQTTTRAYLGSKACAACHESIYRQYSATAMAKSSGDVSGLSLPLGQVTSQASGSRFSYEGIGRFTFERGDAKGSKQAVYFVGSGAAGRSFLWQSGGFLFQLPISWYSAHGWDLSPGYESKATLSLARAVAPECLNCHATGIRHQHGTENGYEWPPALEGGIGCERCHGPGGLHVARAGKGEIVNPAKLDPHLRDSVCAQCHLTGVERIARPGRRIEDYRPGADLNDYAAIFLWEKPEANGLHTTSHYELLDESGCKKGAGDRMWCGSCHDSHAQPSLSARQGYYREKCMSCHSQSGHAAEMAECLSCHMPRRQATDVSGAKLTDHSIPRVQSSLPVTGGRELKAFRSPVEPRELGLAWARIANAQQRDEDFDHARALLNTAYANGSRDAAVATVLAFLEDKAGNEARAIELYENVRSLDPSQAEALLNLGSSYATRGRIADAVDLWREVVGHSLGLESAWVKLATAYTILGRTKEAEEAVRRCLEFHPDSQAAIELKNELGRSKRAP